MNKPKASICKDLLPHFSRRQSSHLLAPSRQANSASNPTKVSLSSVKPVVKSHRVRDPQRATSRQNRRTTRRTRPLLFLAVTKLPHADHCSTQKSTKGLFLALPKAHYTRFTQAVRMSAFANQLQCKRCPSRPLVSSSPRPPLSGKNRL